MVDELEIGKERWYGSYSKKNLNDSGGSMCTVTKEEMDEQIINFREKWHEDSFFPNALR